MNSFVHLFSFLFCLFSFTACAKEHSTPKKNVKEVLVSEQVTSSIVLGAEQFDRYLPLLEGKRVGMVVNQTSVVKETHLVDALLEKGIQVKKVFAPEHGFRGKADAGETVSNGKDAQTGLPIISLYGKNKKPKTSQLADLDIVLFDIQDVGVRFYTYISTLEYVMEACAENNKPLLVLDRPNPNGHYVDGPVLQKEFKSFVGMQSIPVVHGMTVGEYARYLNGEHLLKNGVQAELTVIPCQNYTHKTPYHLPIKPSPNLPNAQAIALYPSLCLFEGTTLSIGRGTNKQFQLIGHPNYEGNFTFMPVTMEGAKYPKHKDKICLGKDLSQAVVQSKLDLSYLLESYAYFQANNVPFFNKNNFFNKLAGYNMKEQIEAGMTEEEIRLTWQEGLKKFKNVRTYYLLYEDFE